MSIGLDEDQRSHNRIESRTEDGVESHVGPYYQQVTPIDDKDVPSTMVVGQPLPGEDPARVPVIEDQALLTLDVAPRTVIETSE